MSIGRWIVTGGAGYIGAHVVRALLATGREVAVVDDLSTGLPGRVPEGVPLIRLAVGQTESLARAFELVSATGVIHLAAKKSPTESISEPLYYAQQNVGGAISVLAASRAAGISSIVFSSSCSVYGTPVTEQVDEHSVMVPETPYGESKLYGERLFEAAATAYRLGVISLRYFNVVGAAAPELADTGASNLVPRVFEAMRVGSRVRVYGGDYPTPDGTCIRDYVDVQDLADAHVYAAEALEQQRFAAVYNVGRGQGTSVLEVLNTVASVTEKATGREIVARRPGDPARVVAKVDRIRAELGWTAKRDLAEMIRSAWVAEQPRGDD